MAMGLLDKILRYLQDLERKGTYPEGFESAFCQMRPYLDNIRTQMRVLCCRLDLHRMKQARFRREVEIRLGQRTRNGFWINSPTVSDDGSVDESMDIDPPSPKGKGKGKATASGVWVIDPRDGQAYIPGITVEETRERADLEQTEYSRAEGMSTSAEDLMMPEGAGSASSGVRDVVIGEERDVSVGSPMAICPQSPEESKSLTPAERTRNDAMDGWAYVPGLTTEQTQRRADAEQSWTNSMEVTITCAGDTMMSGGAGSAFSDVRNVATKRSKKQRRKKAKAVRFEESTDDFVRNIPSYNTVHPRAWDSTPTRWARPEEFMEEATRETDQAFDIL